MKEQLKLALKSIAAGDVQAAESMAEQIKLLPRTEEGLFDMTAVDDKLFEAARWVYPVYAAYETECNKKEGYPDLIVQMRTLNRKFDEVDCFFACGCYLDALIHTIENVSPQLYEYYNELVDMFKRRVNETIAKYYRDGSFLPNAAESSDAIGKSEALGRQMCESVQQEFGDGEETCGSVQQQAANVQRAEQMIRDAIRLAGEKYVLLAEKYEEYI